MPKIPKFGDKKKTPNSKNGKNLFVWLIFILSAVYLLRLGTLSLEGPTTELAYGHFYQILSGKDSSDMVVSAVLKENVLEGRLSSGERFSVIIPDGDPELIKTLRTNVPDFKVVPPKTFLLNVFRQKICFNHCVLRFSFY